MASPALLAVDWGSSSLRAALLDAQGAVLQQMAAPRGLLHIAGGTWAAEFDKLFGPWLARHTGLTTLMCGMVGSRQGWLEAPYAGLPATLDDLAGNLAWVRPGAVAIVPGLCCKTADQTADMPDVMRGEETQVFGALRLLGLEQAPQVSLVLPGTHSKWVQVRQGRIVGFSTHMTGEFYALLRQQSILARLLPKQEPDFDADGFDAGLALAQSPGGLLHHVFGVRTRALLGQREGPWLASHLSGLVLGEELRAQDAAGALAPDQPLVLVGGQALTARYRRALTQRGFAAGSLHQVGDEATWAGLAGLAALAGRVDLPRR